MAIQTVLIEDGLNGSEIGSCRLARGGQADTQQTEHPKRNDSAQHAGTDAFHRVPEIESLLIMLAETNTCTWPHVKIRNAVERVLARPK